MSLTLETLALDGLPEHAVPAFEAALEAVCRSVAFFRDEASDTWRLEAVREPGAKEAELQAALALAAALVGIAPPVLERGRVESEGWLARTMEAFPEQAVGRRLLIRPTHAPPRRVWGRVVVTMDAGLAFGTGEHGSTRGCLLAFERIAHRRPRRILDLGAGSGILGLTAAACLKRRVTLTDIEPWSVRVAERNARLNALPARAIRADGWRDRRLKGRRFDLIFANILARPLAAMAQDLACHLAPGGTAILAGLLGTQARFVLAAHRAQNLVLERRLDLGDWTTLTLRRRA